MTRAPRHTRSAVTIRTVAERAGVSAMTVSNVLRGRPVAAQTREAVLRAVEDLKYRPNPAAQQLASASNVSIGVLQGNIEHSFFSELLVGALNASAERGAQILLQRVDFEHPEAGWQAVEALGDRGAQAVLVPGVIADAMARSGGSSTLPMVAVAPGDDLPGLPSIRIDEFAAGRDMTRRLIAKGHRRIGFIGVIEGYGLSSSRCDGFLAALAEAGLPSAPSLMTTGGLQIAETVAAAEALLDLPEPPTAIFAWNDDFAACALVAAHRRGLNVPRDLAIAGFDDGALATKVWPALTTVRQPVAEMATAAVDALVRAARSRNPAVIESRVLPHTIVLRASTGD